MRSLVVLPVLFAACAEPATPITVTSDGAALVALREGDGEWRALTAEADGKYRFAPDAPYAVVRVCKGGAVTDAEIQLRAPGDDRPWFFDCASRSSTVPVTLAGTLYRTAFIADVRGAPGAVLQVARGTHDVVIVGDGGVKILRDVAIDGPTTLTIDGAIDMVPLVTRSYSSSLAVNITARLFTANGTFADTGTSKVLDHDFPSAILLQTDEHTISATTFPDSPKIWQGSSIRVANDDSVVNFAYPGAIEAPVIGVGPTPHATWTPASSFDLVQLDVEPFKAPGSPRWLFEAHAGWLAGAGGSLVAPDLTTIPGWDPAWTVGGDLLWSSLRLVDFAGDDANEVGWRGGVKVP